MARAVARAARAGPLTGLAGGALVQIPRPVPSRIRVGALTGANQVDRSRVPNGAFSPALRRIASPQGPLARRLLADGGRMQPLVPRLNLGVIVVAPPRGKPDGAIDAADVTSKAAPAFADITFDHATPQRLDIAPGWSRAAAALRSLAAVASTPAEHPPADRALRSRNSGSGGGSGGGEVSK